MFQNLKNTNVFEIMKMNSKKKNVCDARILNEDEGVWRMWDEGVEEG